MYKKRHVTAKKSLRKPRSPQFRPRTTSYNMDWEIRFIQCEQFAKILIWALNESKTAAKCNQPTSITILGVHT